MGWRSCVQGEEEALLAYVAKEPELNLFISGDLLSFGLDGRHVRIQGYGKNGKLAGVLLRYMDRNYVFYTQEKEFPFSEVAAIIRQENPSLKGVCLSGKSSLIKPIAFFLAPLKIQETMMARCNALKNPICCPSEAQVRFLSTVSEFHDVFHLESGIAEFHRNAESEKEALDSFLANSKRGSLCVGVFVDGKLVSCASSTADTSLSSMLVGVCTHPDYRRKGYASLAVGTLIKNRFERGEKFLCLFYDNPLAGRIYHAFGFEDVAPYAMLH